MNTFYDCVKSMHSKEITQDFQKYECKQGIIRGNIDEEGGILIHYIFVHEHLRNTGIFRTFLQQLINDESIKRIWILGVQSQILDDYLCRFETPKGEKFRYQGGDFLLKKKIE